MKKIFSILFIAIICFSCSNSEQTNDNTITTSFYTTKLLTQQMTKDIGSWNVESIIPDGMEVHDWNEPSIKDLKLIEGSKLFVYSGKHMEPWTEKLQQTIKGEVKFLNTSKDIKTSKRVNDPHVWLNPLYALQQVKSIKNQLIILDSVNSELYEKRFNELQLRYNELDNNYRKTIKKFNSKDIVVAHTAYGYLCDAYGLNQIGLEANYEISDPSPKAILDLKQYIKDNNIKHIFFESLSGAKGAKLIADETNIKVLVLESLEGPGELKSKADYFNLMEKNLYNLKEAMQ